MEDRLQIILDYYPDETVMKADGFNDAIIGLCGEKLVYSTKKAIEILMSRDKMSKEDAEEYFDFNISGAYVGDRTPIWVDDMMFE